MVRVADALTVARGAAALPVALLVARRTMLSSRAALALFAVGGVSDLLDGYFARTAGGTALGQQLDPLADKLLIDAALVALASCGRAPRSLVAVLVGRDVIVTALRARRGPGLSPSLAARVKTALLYASVTALLGSREWARLASAGWAGLTLATALAVLSGWEYARRR